MALDARIEVASVPADAIRNSHMAVQPYPAHLVSHIRLADGTSITIRPIRPEDAVIESSFVKGLSEDSRYFRFMHELKELTPEMLLRFTQLDYHRELALIAVLKSAGGAETELAVARYTMNPDARSCEFAVVVADAWQGKGIGTQLMKLLMDAARQRGFAEMNGEVAAGNMRMLRLVKELGFTSVQHGDDPSIRTVSKDLRAVC
jgi:acetyltransferase